MEQFHKGEFDSQDKLNQNFGEITAQLSDMMNNIKYTNGLLTDFNAAIIGGSYTVDNTTLNSPFSGNGMALIIPHKDKNRAAQFGISEFSGIFIRNRYYDGTVSAWEQIATTKSAPLTLINGWTNYGGGYSEVKCTKTGKVVTLSGMVKGGTGTICYLPAGFRPSKTESCVTLLADGATNGLLVANDGSIGWAGTDNRFIALNSVQFIVD